MSSSMRLPFSASLRGIKPKMAEDGFTPIQTRSFVPIFTEESTRIFNKEFNLPPFPLLHNSSQKRGCFFFDQHDRQAQWFHLPPKMTLSAGACSRTCPFSQFIDCRPYHPSTSVPRDSAPSWKRCETPLSSQRFNRKFSTWHGCSARASHQLLNL